MFAEVKDSLPVTGDDYDGQIITKIRAAVLDLTRTTEIVLDGTVDISREWQEIDNPLYDPENDEPEKTYGWVVTDNSTLTDELAITAISLYCNMYIGNPPNFDRLKESYESIKGSMRLSKDYGGGRT